MTFADLVAGDSVFVDANVLIYLAGPDPIFGLYVSNSCRTSIISSFMAAPPPMSSPKWPTNL